MLSKFYFSLFLIRLYEVMGIHLWNIYYAIDRKHYKTLTQFLRGCVHVSIATTGIKKSFEFHSKIRMHTTDVALDVALLVYLSNCVRWNVLVWKPSPHALVGYMKTVQRCIQNLFKHLSWGNFRKKLMTKKH